jgi:hypothetical protein
MENRPAYNSIGIDKKYDRRTFLKTGSMISAGLMLGKPEIWADSSGTKTPQTNIKDALAVKRGRYSLPGMYPGKVVEVHDNRALNETQFDSNIINSMFRMGMEKLTSNSLQNSFLHLFNKNDIIGIKVNPVGPGLISTRLEVVDAVVKWLNDNGIPKKNIIIWDRFDYMLRDAGFTSENFPGVRIEGLQTMDEKVFNGKNDNSRWLRSNGKHISYDKFDPEVYYWADVDGPKDEGYLNQHVFNNKYSFFGKLLTKEVTKIINIPVFKNTGNGISMATKNLGYGAVCNTGRLHKPLFFHVCTEVLAFPVIREKLVLNITDGLRAQYDGGPGPAAEFTFTYNRLFFATDPFALDALCHDLLVNIRKNNGVKVNEHPKYTQYLKYAQDLNIGITDPNRITHVKV